MATASLPRREEIPVEHTWNLESMYADISLWEKDFETVGEKLPGLEAYKGRLAESPKMLLGALKMQDELGVKLDQLASFAHMRKDEDNTNSTFQALRDRAMSLWSQFAGTASFITPELIALPEQQIERYLQEEAGLQLYRHML